MRRVLTILGVLLIVFGAIWFFQGTDVLPGSFMTGQRRWAVNGGVAVGAGIVLIIVARLIKKKVPPPAT
jgi:hypothetical protein